MDGVENGVVETLQEAEAAIRVAEGGYASLDDLFRPRLPERDHVIETSVGTIKVRLRAITRAVIKACRAEALEDEHLFDMLVIARSVVVPAGMTATDADRWHSAAPAGEFLGLQNAIQVLSGLAEGSVKSGL